MSLRTREIVSEEIAAGALLPSSHPDVFLPDSSNGGAPSDFLPSSNDRFICFIEELRIETGIELKTPAPEITSAETQISMLSAIADHFESAHRSLGSIDSIETAIKCQRQALLLTEEGYASRPMLFAALGRLFHYRFEQLGNVTDIEEAIRCQTQATVLIPSSSVEKPAYLNNLGIFQLNRFHQLGDMADMDKATENQMQAVQLTPENHTGKPGRLNSLGASYLSRFERLGSQDDLDKATEYLAQAVHLTPEGHPDRPAHLNNLANCWVDRFGQLDNLDDIDKAIECQIQSVQLSPKGHPSMPNFLNNLGNMWRYRFDRIDNLADIDKAIEHQTQAVQLTPEANPDKPIRLSNLGVSLTCRFKRLDDLTDIDRAIECLTQAVQLYPKDHPEKPSCLNNLGSSWSARFERLGYIADIDKAIECQAQAVQLPPDNHIRKSAYLSNLGAAWLRRFDRLGDVADTDKAVEFLTQALQLIREGHPDKPHYLNKLGSSYSHRFEQLGNIADIDKSIELNTQAVQLTPDDHPEKPIRLNSLGISWIDRFERLGKLTDLDKAIDCQARAARLVPLDRLDRPRYLDSLGSSYLSRFEQLENLSDLGRATVCHTQAVQLTHDSHPNKSAYLTNLGSLWFSEFKRLSDLNSIDKAIECLVQAVQLIPEGHSNKPSRLQGLGILWLSRYEFLGSSADLEAACVSFKQGAELSVTDARAQIQCTRKWVECSALLGSSPLQAYQKAFTLIPHLVWLGRTIKERYVILAEISDLAADAAAWAISVKNYDIALEWLEQGRSIVWNQILQLRTPFDSLAVVNLELANRLKYTAAQLEAASSPKAVTGLYSDYQANLDSQARYHRRLAALWEDLLIEARGLPGFSDFMQPRNAQELKRVAIDGPIIIINTHITRCDALIVLPQCEDMVHVPLGELSLDKSVKIRTQIEPLISRHGNGNKARAVKYHEPIVCNKDQLRPLIDLWSDVVGPALNVLRYKLQTPHSELPHVTWCATGALSSLPLHAAGLYDGLSPNAIDLVVSSYTPSLSALVSQNASSTVPQHGVLAVGQANSHGLSPLPKTVEELAIIKKYAKEIQFHQLDGELATVGATLSAMDEHSWVHLACHAIQNRANPSHSAFYLRDGTLTLEMIARRHFKSKGLAFLSACQTATGGDSLPDEATHLAAGMLMAGYPTVIATMWSILDDDAPDIAEEVYAMLLQGEKIDCTNAARALHKAVRKLREKVGVTSIGRWSPFVHIGL